MPLDFMFDEPNQRFSTPVTVWTPYALGAALKAWWSADDHGTPLMTDDGAGLISAWVDRVNAVSVTAATTARPTWSATSLNSAYPGVTFDGVANAMVNTAFTALPTGATAGELFALVSQGSLVADPGGTILRYGGTAGATVRAIQRAAVSSVNRLRGTDGVTSVTSLDGDFSGPNVGHVTFSGTTGTVDINGSASTTATIATLNTSTTRLRIGANNATSPGAFWIGVIGDVVVTTTLTDPQRQQVIGYLAWKAGLAGLLPVSFPYKNGAP